MALETTEIIAPITFGQRGKSAYQYYTETTTDDPVLTEAEWIIKAEASKDAAAASASAAATSETNSGNSATQTAADAVQTAADRVAVASDKAAVSASEISVSADASQVSTDAAQVAADKTTVANYKSSVAADAATVNADKITVAGVAAQVSVDALQVSTDAAQVTSDAADISTDAAQVSTDAAQVASDKTTVTTLAGEVSTDRATVQGLATQVSNDRAAVAADKSTVATNTATTTTKAGEAATSAATATTKAGEAAALRDQTQVIADSIQQPPQTLTDAAVVVYNAALGLNATLTLTASRWLQVISNATPGQSGQLWIYQDAVGAHSLALDYGYTDVLGNLSDITTLAAGEMALVRWFTEDGANFDLYINKIPAFPISQFSPLNYLTATDGVQVAGGADALDGDSVALWANQSGTGTGAAQTVAVSQPTFRTSPDRLKFDGVDDTVGFDLDGSAGYTIALKISSADWSKSQAVASLWVSYQFLIRKFSGAVPWEVRFFTNPSLSITDSINANAADDWVIVMTHDAVNQKVRVIFNGREFEENYTFDVSSYPAKKFELGSYANQTSWFSDASYHKFFAAERELSMDEMRTLSSFLQKS